MARALAWCALAYALAIVLGGGAMTLWPDGHAIWRLALADVVGTLVVFAFSRAFDNSSLYDPYWSVAPLVMVPAWWVLGDAPLTARVVLIHVCIAAWGVRLTYSCLRRWRGLEHEDFRYVDLRERHGRAYWVVSLMGIHVFPTVLVFLGCVPAYYAVTSSVPITWLDAAGLVVAGGAIAVEAVSDRQLHDFLAGDPKPGSTLASGLWRYSRHPNYFGEVSFWWGVLLFGLAAAPAAWWTLLGPVAITALFVFISVPLLDRRMLARRPGYAEHMRRTSAIVPLPPRV